MKSSGRIFIFLLLLSLVLPASASSTILETEVTLSPFSPDWSVDVNSIDKELVYFISTTQGNLNFTLVQQDNLVISRVITSSDNLVTGKISVDRGSLRVILEQSGNIIPSQIQISLQQPDPVPIGFYYVLGTVFLVLLPFTYLFGKQRGQDYGN